jgi:ABC-type cobalamin transport system ATPase subunit
MPANGWKSPAWVPRGSTLRTLWCKVLCGCVRESECGIIRQYMAYNTRNSLRHRHREALRAYLVGARSTECARIAGLAPVTFSVLLGSKAGKAFLTAERDRIDAHRTLVAATLPHFALMHGLSDSKQVAENIGKIGDSLDSDTNLQRIAAVKAALEAERRARMAQETPDPVPPTET